MAFNSCTAYFYVNFIFMTCNNQDSELTYTE
nr:MAG TPA: hypothetical protein [Caudoviricetes sp.]